MGFTQLIAFVLLIWCFSGALVVGPQILQRYLSGGRGQPGRTYGLVVGSQLAGLVVMLVVLGLVGNFPGAASKALAVGAIAAYAPCVLWALPALVRGRGVSARSDPVLTRAVLVTMLPFVAVGILGACLPVFVLAFG